MIFSDISSLNIAISNHRSHQYVGFTSSSLSTRSNAAESTNSVKAADILNGSDNIAENLTRNLSEPPANLIKFSDVRDLVVEKWYNSSPPMTGNAIFPYEFEESGEDQSSYSPKGSNVAKDNKKNRDALNENNNSKNPLFLRIPASMSDEELFKPVPVEKIKSVGGADTQEKAPVSLLSAQLSTIVAKRQGTDGTGVSLVIYFPNTSSIKILVPRKCPVSEIIKISLREHKDRAMRPVLDYDSPRNYVLRMHDTDGEPDMDFAVFENDQEVQTIYETAKSNEFCLCVDGDRDSDDSDFVESRGNNNSRKLQPYSNEVVSDYAASKAENETSTTMSSSPILSENSILITVNPNAKPIGVNVNKEKTTLRNVLSWIATQYKLRIYVDEFSFYIDEEEQKRLNLTSQVADLDVPIKSIRANKFELRRKEFADVARISRPKGDYSNVQMTTDSNKIVYNEITAAAYQEWKIIKKNVQGRRQERYMGIDADRIYNSRRGQYSGGGSAGVYRAHRDISTIRKVELVREDPELKTLRITFAESKVVSEIEYSCETQRDCNEIIAKVKHLMRKYQVGI